MRYELVSKPDFTITKTTFDSPGEQLLVEASAMVARDAGVEMQTQMQGGLLSAAKRKVLGGESIFQNTFTATRAGQTLWVAPGPEGDMEALELDGAQPLFLQSGAFVASAPTVELDTKWEGARGFFSGQGLFLLRAAGTGPIFFATYGGVHAVDIGPQGYPGYVCDTGHIVAFSAGLSYEVQRVGGLKSLFFSGEGLIARFSGQGRLWMSTRTPANLASFLHPYRPVQGNNQNSN